MNTKPLFKHQIATIEFLRKTDRAYIASTAGTAKSRCVVMDVQNRLNANPDSKTLILAPKSLLHTVWENEFAMWTPLITVSIAMAPEKKRQEAFETNANVYITNIDALVWLAKKPSSFWNDYETVIIDESTCIANDSGRTKSAMKIKQHFKYRRCLSGTPTSGLLTQLFFQYMFLDDGATLGTSFYKFRNQVLIAKQNGPHPKMVKWSNKPGREKILAYMLKPMTIRYVLNEVIDMPPTLKFTYKYKPNAKSVKAYLQMKKTAKVYLDTGEVNAINAAAMSTKLRQIACLTGDTEVLTDSGWKEIIELDPIDKLWDGEEWINYDKVLDNGHMDTINCWGVQMTLGHKLLTDQGWKEAWEIKNGESSKRFNRSNFRVPNSIRKSRIKTSWQWDIGTSIMGMPMRVWQFINTFKSKYTPQETKKQKLWVQTRIGNDKSWTCEAWQRASSLQQMEQNKKSLFLYTGQRLQKLWGSRNNVKQRVAKFSNLCGRYVSNFQDRINFGPYKQLQRIQQNELQMEYTARTTKQHENKRIYKYTKGKNDSRPSGKDLSNKSRNSTKTFECGLERKHIVTKNKVYDILNAGNKHQFLIRNKQGDMFISHNSGFAYNTETRTSHLVDLQRYDLVLDICNQYKHAVVFFNWKAQREYFMKQADKRGINATFIDGSVSVNNRKDRVNDFQDGKYDVIFLQPQSSAHGITLTKSNVTIWSSPTHLSDYYSQGNNRVYRAGQEKRTTVINIEAEETVDAKVYVNLSNKLNSMDLLTDEF